LKTSTDQLNVREDSTGQEENHGGKGKERRWGQRNFGFSVLTIWVRHKLAHRGKGLEDEHI
jgi:hypothetical protein